VLRHIRAQLPHENLLYFADSGFAPYGDKPESAVAERTLAVADFLLDAGCKALVVACNTATAAAIHLLRKRHPMLPIVGIEPGLKPAAALTKTGTIGVLATDRTLASAKFRLLHDQLAASTGVRFVTQPCPGLADLIEMGDLHSERTAQLVKRYVEPLLAKGADTLVLGCTHYPFVRHAIERILDNGSDYQIVDTGVAVARQLARVIDSGALGRSAGESELKAFTTGVTNALVLHFERLLQMSPPVMQATVGHNQVANTLQIKEIGA
jgi:glutamate racemase